MWLLISNYYFMPKAGYTLQAKHIEYDLIMSGNDREESVRQIRELLPGETVNINTADETELQQLKGIGSGLSSAIVLYREEHGPFRSIEEIKNVPGIGEGRFQAIRDSISVGGDS